MIDDTTDVSRHRLEQSARSGATWFYWVAGLSVINSVAALSGGSLHFPVGLAFTQLLDAIVGPGSLPVRLVGYGLHLWLVAGFIAIGYYARSRVGAYTIGLVLYGLDALLSLGLQLWATFGFHLFALFFIWVGRTALSRLSAASPSPLVPSAFAPTPLPPAPLTSSVSSGSTATYSCQRCGTVLLGAGSLCVRCLSQSA